MIPLRRIPSPLPFQTPGEEIANAILHGSGAALAVPGMILLLLRAQGLLGGRGGGITALISYCIFSAAMIVLFLSSTLYHAIRQDTAKRVFRVFDHSAIYLLIAGTYTPFCLVALQGVWGWFLFAVEWSLAVIGTALYAMGARGLKKIEVGVYILMGWMILMGWKPLIESVPEPALILLILGGASYTLGTVWYGIKARRGTHVVWHVFVLMGAIFHWAAVWHIS